MEKNMIIILGITAIAYLALRAYMMKDKGSVDKEMEEIINSDEYKVKGQFD